MKKIKILLSFLLLLGCYFTAKPQSKALSKKLKGFDQFAEQVLSDWSAVGVGVAVVYKGEVILSKGYGYRDLDNKKPVDENTLFAIGSSSKAFTAAGACILADDKELDLDEPVITYLPDFRMWEDYTTLNINVRDMLCHRSGLPRHDFVWYGSTRSREDMYQSLQYLEPSTGFREGWQYQNLMFMTVGYLTGKISGMGWEGFIKKRILDPLGMKNTNFSVEAMKKSSNASLGYARGDDNKIEKKEYRNLDAIGPAGSINSSVKEMSNWVKMQLNNGKFGEEQIISSPYIQQMQSPHMTIPGSIRSDGTFYTSYGLGWMISAYRSHLIVEHGGNIDGFSALVTLMPRDSFGIVILSNQDVSPIPTLLRANLCDRLLDLEIIDKNSKALERVKKMEDNKDEIIVSIEDDPNRVKGTSPSHDLSDYAGSFEHKGYGVAAMEIKNDSLHITFNGIEINLQHYHYDVFAGTMDQDQVLKFNFKLDDAGNISGFSTDVQSGVEPILFERVPEEVVMEASALQKYEGTYEIGGMELESVVVDGKLFLKITGQPDYELTPLGKDKFDLADADGFSCSFKVEGEGPASELILNQPNGTFSAKRKN